MYKLLRKQIISIKKVLLRCISKKYYLEKKIANFGDDGDEKATITTTTTKTIKTIDHTDSLHSFNFLFFI